MRPVLHGKFCNWETSWRVLLLTTQTFLPTNASNLLSDQLLLYCKVEHLSYAAESVESRQMATHQIDVISADAQDPQ